MRGPHGTPWVGSAAPVRRVRRVKAAADAGHNVQLRGLKGVEIRAAGLL